MMNKTADEKAREFLESYRVHLDKISSVTVKLPEGIRKKGRLVDCTDLNGYLTTSDRRTFDTINPLLAEASQKARESFGRAGDFITYWKIEDAINGAYTLGGKDDRRI